MLSVEYTWMRMIIIFNIFEKSKPGIIIIETHLAPNYRINIENYKSSCQIRLHTHRNAKRHYGGLYSVAF